MNVCELIYMICMFCLIWYCIWLWQQQQEKYGDSALLMLILDLTVLTINPINLWGLKTSSGILVMLTEEQCWSLVLVLAELTKPLNSRVISLFLNSFWLRDYNDFFIRARKFNMYELYYTFLQSYSLQLLFTHYLYMNKKILIRCRILVQGTKQITKLKTEY